jgi:hypothetical protein
MTSRSMSVDAGEAQGHQEGPLLGLVNCCGSATQHVQTADGVEHTQPDCILPS